jgi:hypothetical protein
VNALLPKTMLFTKGNKLCPTTQRRYSHAAASPWIVPELAHRTYTACWVPTTENKVDDQFFGSNRAVRVVVAGNSWPVRTANIIQPRVC